MFGAYYVDQYMGSKSGEERSPLFGAYVIISESMIPSINVYDAVVTMRADENDIEIQSQQQNESNRGRVLQKSPFANIKPKQLGSR